MYSGDGMVRNVIAFAVVLSLLGGCSSVERTLSNRCAVLCFTAKWP